MASSSSSSRKQRTHLSLKDKVEIITKSKNNPGIVCGVADIFCRSKTQVSVILKKFLPLLSLTLLLLNGHEFPNFPMLMSLSINGIALLAPKTFIPMAHNS